MNRPELENNMDVELFLNFYYLKKELIDFCRDNGLPIQGGKIELTERIANYLRTGKIKQDKTKRVVKQKCNFSELELDWWK
jgi:hypothetical protein